MARGNPLSEITVTCHQCGSAAMDRLDRKEYRCTHCGAITLVSDDDAERLEELLRQALNRPDRPVPPRSTRPASAGATAAGIFLLVGISVIIGLSIALSGPKHHGSPNYISYKPDPTVSPSEVSISQLTWNSDRHRYEGMVYNHSGYAIHVPRYTMTLYTNGHRSGSTWADTALDRLLPGEYEPIDFDPHVFSNQGAPDRYEIDPIDAIGVDTDEIARPELTQQLLVHQDGGSFDYKFVGIIRNNFTRPIERSRVLLMLYGPDNRVVGTDEVSLETLRPGEDGLVDMNIDTHPRNLPVSAYEYIVDSTYPTPAGATAVQPSSEAPKSRIVQLQNPHIRILPKGAEFTAQDLLDSIGKPPAPPFDPKYLVIKTPRRMKDEEGNTIFLGEVTNTSPDQVAMAPVAMLTLTKGGQTVDTAEHGFPDLTPGAHVPVFFHYDGEPKAFDAIRLDWKPLQSYQAADDHHPELKATIAAKDIKHGDTVVNFTRTYYYDYADVSGSIANSGHAAAKRMKLFIILRDAKGEITGYEGKDIGGPLVPGASTDFAGGPVIWGGPVATVEAIALPVSPPAL